jgi:hypothetical protein
MSGDVTERTGKPRGSYALSARLQQTLLLLASGECRTQREAGERTGLSVRALQKSLKRESVKKFMVEHIMSNLSISAMRASKVLDDLMMSSENDMVRYHSTKHTLATAFGIAPPQRPGVHVNVSGSGFIVDLRERPEELSARDQAALADARAGGLPGAVLGAGGGRRR